MPHFLPSSHETMRRIEQTAMQVARSDETVLLLGETGVGKDRLAARIHEASARGGGRFVPLNCAALPDGLLEAELFGHVRGAYTGAIDSQPGQFEAARGGTLFLDEIGEMSPHMQAKLLHVLQSGSFFRVGGREPMDADVRIIAATNRDLDLAMAQGLFRRDLYYRLSVVCLRIPSLRERPSDIESLARFFAFEYSRIYNAPHLREMDERILRRLQAHRFDGNIRELENLVKRGILLGSFDDITEELDRSGGSPCAEVLSGGGAAEAAGVTPRPLREIARQAVEAAERRAIGEALAATGWNRRRAARLLRISYRSLLYKIQDYGLVPPGPRSLSLPEPSYPLRDAAATLSPREGSC